MNGFIASFTLLVVATVLVSGAWTECYDDGSCADWDYSLSVDGGDTEVNYAVDSSNSGNSYSSVNSATNTETNVNSYSNSNSGNSNYNYNYYGEYEGDGANSGDGSVSGTYKGHESGHVKSHGSHGSDVRGHGSLLGDLIRLPGDVAGGVVDSVDPTSGFLGGSARGHAGGSVLGSLSSRGSLGGAFGIL